MRRCSRTVVLPIQYIITRVLLYAAAQRCEGVSRIGPSEDLARRTVVGRLEREHCFAAVSAEQPFRNDCRLEER